MPFRWASPKYMCFFCGCQYEDSSALKQHTKEEHENPKLQNALAHHKIKYVKLDVSQASCKLCPKPISGLSEFMTHAAKDHDFQINQELVKGLFSFKLSEGNMRCLDCRAEFDFFGSLLAHAYKLHNNSAEFLCEVCGQGFISKTKVTSHVRRLHGTTECRVCLKVFPKYYNMKVHLQKEHKQERLKCPKCPEVLGSQHLKMRHLALVHPEQRKMFKCDQCSKEFTVKSKLKEHSSNYHLKEKKLACNVCGFKVFNQNYLTRHMERHNDARPFECDICKKTFKRKKTLTLHRRIHTNDKRQVCKECGKAFVQVTSLKLHLRVHH